MESKYEEMQYAAKCYERFCDEFITALKNIESIKRASAMHETMGGAIKLGIQEQAKAEFCATIIERAEKERYLQYPRVTREQERSFELDIRKDVEKLVDEVFPWHEFRGILDPRKMERRKGRIASFLSDKLKEAFIEGCKIGEQQI